MKNNRLSRFAIPYVIWMALFVVAPIIMVVIYAFSASVGGFTLDNFAKMGTYTVVFTRSFKLALIATAICVLIGYPVSYKMSKEGPWFQRLAMVLIMLPLGIDHPEKADVRSEDVVVKGDQPDLPEQLIQKTVVFQNCHPGIGPQQEVHPHGQHDQHKHDVLLVHPQPGQKIAHRKGDDKADNGSNKRQQQAAGKH